MTINLIPKELAVRNAHLVHGQVKDLNVSHAVCWTMSVSHMTKRPAKGVQGAQLHQPIHLSVLTVPSRTHTLVQERADVIFALEAKELLVTTLDVRK